MVTQKQESRAAMDKAGHVHSWSARLAFYWLLVLVLVLWSLWCAYDFATVYANVDTNRAFAQQLAAERGTDTGAFSAIWDEPARRAEWAAGVMQAYGINRFVAWGVPFAILTAIALWIRRAR